MCSDSLKVQFSASFRVQFDSSSIQTTHLEFKHKCKTEIKLLGTVIAVLAPNVGETNKTTLLIKLTIMNCCSAKKC